MGCVETIFLANKEITQFNFKYVNGNCEITEVGEENKELQKIATNQKNFFTDMQKAHDKESSESKSPCVLPLRGFTKVNKILENLDETVDLGILPQQSSFFDIQEFQN